MYLKKGREKKYGARHFLDFMTEHYMLRKLTSAVSAGTCNFVFALVISARAYTMIYALAAMPAAYYGDNRRKKATSQAPLERSRHHGLKLLLKYTDYAGAE